MFFVWESFLRLERFLRDCDSYTRRFDTGVAVVLSYNALFTYVFVLVYPRLRRSLIMLAFTSGLGLAGLALWGVASVAPELTNARTPCALEQDGRPAEEAMITTHTAVFLVFYDWLFPPERWHWSAVKVLVLALYEAASLGAPWYLGLQAAPALLGGAAFGVLGAVLGLGALACAHRHRGHRWTACLARWCKVSPPEDPNWGAETAPLLTRSAHGRPRTAPGTELV